MAKTRPRWYFSLRSPYSWLAYRDLTQRYPDVAGEIDWLPFWEPDPQTTWLLAEANVELPIVPMSRAKNFYILQDTRRLARARGLAMTWPVDRDPVWEVSHLGYLVAAAQGQGRRYVDLVYRVRWEQGLDICDRAVIGGVAAELGLDPGPVSTAADDPELRRQGTECLIRSYHDGLFGVPFFVLGRDKYFGVDRLRAFARAYRGEPADSEPADDEAADDEAGLAWLEDLTELPALTAPGIDGGPAGGCG